MSTVVMSAPWPICIGLRPPRLPLGAVPARTVLLMMSLNVGRAPRKPAVLTLARLLPMTSM
jgi:hypothetical protein